MDATMASDPIPMRHGATVERTSDREMVVSRTINGPARLVFEVWTRPDLFERWWTPKSFPISLLSVEMDARAGGTYRLTFGHEGSTFDFFGRYLEVTPYSRLSWTNDEADAGEQITTVTFEEADGATLVVVHDLYASKEALDAAIASGSTSGMPESLEQLDTLVTGVNT
ncbi:MAG: SRPBCC family protein [Chloroflexi bacterium]|nr:SRPBCC family protein [Chloroflexota bacterium]